MFVIQANGEFDELGAYCVVCQRPLTDAGDFIAYAPPARKGVSSGYLVHRRCADRRLTAICGPGFKLLRLDEALKRVVVKLTV